MNPFKTIWLKPRRTFEEFVLNNESQSLFGIPIIILGISIGLNEYANSNELSLTDLLTGILIGIGMSFLILGLAIPGMILVFGRIWKGQATMRQLANVCSISYIPFCVIFINQLVLITIGENGALDLVNQGVLLVLWIWSFSLLVVGVAVVQRFSYGLALLNILISDLPFLIIGLLTMK